MKTFLFFCLTCLVSTGAMLVALHEKNPFPNFAAAFGIWGLFIWVQHRAAGKGIGSKTVSSSSGNLCAQNLTVRNSGGTQSINHIPFLD